MVLNGEHETDNEVHSEQKKTLQKNASKSVNEKGRLDYLLRTCQDSIKLQSLSYAISQKILVLNHWLYLVESRKQKKNK